MERRHECSRTSASRNGIGDVLAKSADVLQAAGVPSTVPPQFVDAADLSRIATSDAKARAELVPMCVPRRSGAPVEVERSEAMLAERRDRRGCSRNLAAFPTA